MQGSVVVLQKKDDVITQTQMLGAQIHQISGLIARAFFQKHLDTFEISSFRSS